MVRQAASLKAQAEGIEGREKAVAAREAEAERKVAAGREAIASAHMAARAEVEREYVELKVS